MELPVRIGKLSVLNRLKCINLVIKENDKVREDLPPAFMEEFKKLTRTEAGEIVGGMEGADKASLILFVPKNSPKLEILLKYYKESGNISLVCNNFGGQPQVIPMSILQELVEAGTKIENLHQVEVYVIGTISGENGQEGKIPDPIRQFVFGKLKIGY